MKYLIKVLLGALRQTQRGAQTQVQCSRPRSNTTFCWLLFLLLSWSSIHGQEQVSKDSAEEDKKGKYALKVSGSFNFGGELYSVNGISNRRSPWSYTTSGQLGLSVGKFRLPISFTYRDRQFAYDFKFNRFGMSPTLGWATLHLGWRSMNFSPYTLGGRTFFGIGTELRPGKFYVGALYGTIQNPLAIRDSLTFGANLIPIFERKLYGAKVGFRTGKHHLELMAVKIFDDQESFEYPENYDERGYQILTPKENIVAGVNAGFEVAKTVEVYLRTGLTLFTNDLDDPLTGTISGVIPDQYEDLLTVNTSSLVTFAGDGGVNVSIKGTKLGFQYRRVEPFYTTLAAQFFQNDLEQYTGLLSTGLFKRKLLFTGRVGVERNNLRGYRTNETSRIIINASASWRPNDDWSWNLRAANFTTNSNPEILELNDTLRYVTVNTNVALNGSWTIRQPSKDLRINLFLNHSGVDDQSLVQRLDELNTYASTLSAAWTWKETNLTVGPSLQFFRYNLAERTQERFGLGLQVGKSFWDKRLSANLGSSLSQNDINGFRDGTLGLHRLRLRYKLSKKQSISLMNSFRHAHSLSRQSFREWRSQLRYGLRF